MKTLQRFCLLTLLVLIGLPSPALEAKKKNNVKVQSVEPGTLPTLPPEAMPQSAEELFAPLNNMSPQELDEFLKFLESLPPEEVEALAELGEQVMRDMGIDPEELAQQMVDEMQKNGQPAPAPVPDLPQPPQKEEPQPAKAPKAQLEQARSIIVSIVGHVGSLRQKAEADPRIVERLAPYNTVLNDLVYFLLALNKDELLKYLVDPEFIAAYNSLKEFNSVLDRYEPQFQVKELDEDQTPYEQLGIPQTAHEEQIEQAYQRTKQEHEARKALHHEKKRAYEKLKDGNGSSEDYQVLGLQENASQDDIHQAFKQEKVLYDDEHDEFKKVHHIYERLKNKSSRAVIDRDVQRQQDMERRIKKQSQQALSVIERALDVLQQQKLIDNLIALFKKHEPELLKKKKELDEQAAQVEKEARSREQRPGRKTGAILPTDRPRGGYSARSFDYDDEPSYGSYYNGSYSAPSRSYEPARAAASGQPAQPAAPRGGKQPKKAQGGKAKSESDKDGAATSAQKAPAKKPGKKPQPKKASSPMASVINTRMKKIGQELSDLRTLASSADSINFEQLKNDITNNNQPIGRMAKPDDVEQQMMRIKDKLIVINSKMEDIFAGGAAMINAVPNKDEIKQAWLNGVYTKANKQFLDKLKADITFGTRTGISAEKRYRYLHENVQVDREVTSQPRNLAYQPLLETLNATLRLIEDANARLSVKEPTK